MKFNCTTYFLRTATLCCLMAQFSTNAISAEVVTPEQTIAAAAQQNKPIFLMFYKEKNSAGDQMAAAVKAHSAVKAQQATWTTVRVSDPAERALAEKLKVTRAPMPTLVALHPNGAITGVFPNRITDEQLSSCLVSPKAAELLKQLQDNRLVLICVQTASGQAIPVGAQEFKADPHYAQRTTVITVSLNDAKEQSFLNSMGIDPAKTVSPTTLFLAPPGVHVGTYAASVSKTELAAGLAAAGKCCDDKNCKHNQQTSQK